MTYLHFVTISDHLKKKKEIFGKKSGKKSGKKVVRKVVRFRRNSWQKK